MSKHNLFGSQSQFVDSNVGEMTYYRLEALEEASLCSISRLPYCIRVLLESALRNYNGFSITEEHVRKIASWNKNRASVSEIAFVPARVLLQDFTGVPALVDLAAMRDEIVSRGGQADKVNPLIPCDLVVDHSICAENYGSADAKTLNEFLEMSQNIERYNFLKWGQSSFSNFRVVPPGAGIIHQINLEYLANAVCIDKNSAMIFPDSCLGTDSHTTMTCGIGVLSWGVGGIEAEAVMLGQPYNMALPEVIGIKLIGKLSSSVSATDLVLSITQFLRKIGVVGRFVEFFGQGVSSLTVADRATISNMSPEQGSTVSFFPVDEKVLEFLLRTGRDEKVVAATRDYLKIQKLFYDLSLPEPEYTKVYEFELTSVVPSISGPKKPHDRIDVSSASNAFSKSLAAPIGPQGFGLSEESVSRSSIIEWEDGAKETISHGSVVIAAITSCTNTSNPSLLISAGLLARNAVEKGLKVPRYVKTSLAPGSQAVTEYLNNAGLLSYLEQLGFYLIGYGCTTCIGNSGSLKEEVSKAIKQNDLVVASVLSGNRNFEGRVHSLVRANYLASPLLVVAYSLLGSVKKDLLKTSLGSGLNGEDIFFTDILPSMEECGDIINKYVNCSVYKKCYHDIFAGTKKWQDIKSTFSEVYTWNQSSTYISKPPFFPSKSNMTLSNKICRVLGFFGDFVTTDHISPAGSIAKESPAAKYLAACGVEPKDFNTYGSRRGNYEVMMRGTFANIRIKNKLANGKEGNVTKHFPSGEEMSFYDAAMRYAKEDIFLIILAGKEYGSGSSRDWAAKGPYLLGVKAVIAQGYERIHRSNLIGMGILPLQFLDGESADSLGLDGSEGFFIKVDSLSPCCSVKVISKSNDGEEISFDVTCRIDTEVELKYYKNGGILNTVLGNLVGQD